MPPEKNKPEAKKLEETRQLDYQVGATWSHGYVAQKGRALALHARGTGIETPHLQIYLFTKNCRNIGICGDIPTETNKPEAKKLKETGQLDYPVWATRYYGDVTQMVQRLLRIREVRRSILRTSKSTLLPTTVGFMGTVELYRLRQTILRQRIQKKQGNLITQFGQPDLMGM